MKPFGGHAIYLDGRAFCDHLQNENFPGWSLSVALYENLGVRACEIGNVMFGIPNEKTGEWTWPNLDLVRLAIPRRVYTQSHMDYVIEGIVDIFQNRHDIRGIHFLHRPSVLPHFTARFAFKTKNKGHAMNISLQNLRNNPSLLKLDLYCKGTRIDDSCLIEEDGGRAILRTRAGLGSGLEAILPGNLWTNIPVSEPFAQDSPYTVHRKQSQYWLHWNDDPVTQFTLAPRPDWYDGTTSSGKKNTSIGTLQGTYLGVYPAKVCEYWTEVPDKTNCKFCSLGLNLGVDDADEKSVDEVLEVVRIAREQSGITYVDFNTGHYEGDTYLDILIPYIKRIKEEFGLLIGVQTPPHRDLKRYDELRELGVNRVSFCFEIFDRPLFEEICPGKHREYGLDYYLEAIEYCATLGKKGAEIGTLGIQW